jgi:hypothetical protein
VTEQPGPPAQIKIRPIAAEHDRMISASQAIRRTSVADSGGPVIR